MLLGDIHLSELSPSNMTDSYCQDIIAILEHTVGLESSLGIDAVIWSGDTFHHRNPNRNSHRLVQRAIDLVQSYKNLYIVVGNHDLARGERLESVFETQPLGILYKAGAKILDGWAEDGSDIFGVSWQPSWTTEAVEKAFEGWHKESSKRNLSNCLTVAHAPLYPPGLESPWESYPVAARPGVDDRKPWSAIQQKGFTYLGHVHDCHGTYKVDGVTFCNQGAITRGSLAESDLKRAIAVTTWSPEEGFVRVDVPYRNSSEIFKLMEHHEKEEKKADLSEFLDSVWEAQIEITSITSIIEYLHTMELPEDVVRLAVELLQESQ